MRPKTPPINMTIFSLHSLSRTVPVNRPASKGGLSPLYFGEGEQPRHTEAENAASPKPLWNSFLTAMREQIRRISNVFRRNTFEIIESPPIQVVKNQLREEHFWPYAWEWIQQTLARAEKAPESLETMLEKVGGIEKLYPLEGKTTVTFTKVAGKGGNADFRITVNDHPYHFDLADGYGPHDLCDHILTGTHFTSIGEKVTSAVQSTLSFLATGQDELYGIMNRLAHFDHEVSFYKTFEDVLAKMAEPFYLPYGTSITLDFYQPLPDRSYVLPKTEFQPRIPMLATGFFTPTSWDKIERSTDPKDFPLFLEILEKARQDGRVKRQSGFEIAAYAVEIFDIQLPPQPFGRGIDVIDAATQELAGMQPEDLMLRIELERNKQTKEVQGIRWDFASKKNRDTRNIQCFSREELLLLAQGLVNKGFYTANKGNKPSKVVHIYEKEHPQDKRRYDTWRFEWDNGGDTGINVTCASGTKHVAPTGQVTVIHPDVPTAPTVLGNIKFTIPMSGTAFQEKEKQIKAYSQRLQHSFQAYQERLFDLLQQGRLDKETIKQSSVFNMVFGDIEKSKAEFHFDGRPNDVTHRLVKNFFTSHQEDIFPENLIRVFPALPGPTVDKAAFQSLYQMQLERVQAASEKQDLIVYDVPKKQLPEIHAFSDFSEPS